MSPLDTRSPRPYELKSVFPGIQFPERHPDPRRGARNRGYRAKSPALPARRLELRLSAEQAEELAAAYPADVRPMGGSWYEITFQGAFTYGN